MEKFNSPDLRKSQSFPRELQQYWEKAKDKVLNPDNEIDLKGVSHTVDQYLKQRAMTASRRKWAGRGLSLFGATTLLSSCAISIFSTTGFYTAGLGIALLLGGFALSSWKPRLKDTTEALIAAHKYGNVLNTTRLSLEMDISPDKAESILQELVKKGIAEIDLESQSGDNHLNYRIKGL
ncbi:MAG: hypothetical protein AB7V04_10435 [Desulfomonilaceae bacterium]